MEHTHIPPEKQVLRVKSKTLTNEEASLCQEYHVKHGTTIRLIDTRFENAPSVSKKKKPNDNETSSAQRWFGGCGFVVNAIGIIALLISLSQPTALTQTLYVCHSKTDRPGPAGSGVNCVNPSTGSTSGVIQTVNGTILWVFLLVLSVLAVAMSIEECQPCGDKPTPPKHICDEFGKQKQPNRKGNIEAGPDNSVEDDHRVALLLAANGKCKGCEDKKESRSGFMWKLAIGIGGDFVMGVWHAIKADWGIVASKVGGILGLLIIWNFTGSCEDWKTGIRWIGRGGTISSYTTVFQIPLTQGCFTFTQIATFLYSAAQALYGSYNGVNAATHIFSGFWFHLTAVIFCIYGLVLMFQRTGACG